jgi:MoaA/NifB/PqqE/SkfB family radical SAM enzyme
MYRYQDIRDIHLEITSKCQAKCPMCPRRISGGPLNPFIKLDEITLDVFKQWFEPDFIKQLDSLFMCGNLGDPIISKDTLEIYQYLRELNPNIRLAMHTNGSARDPEWWQRLAQLKVKVTFGIDGLADTHHLYRISTDFNKIIENARAFITAGGVAKWHMLVFAHNEHQIEEARTMSKQMGFVDFSIKHTSRFKQDYLQVIDDAGRPTHRIKPTQTSLNMIPLAEAAQKEVKPHIVCKAQKFKQLYVSACGNVSPCCWLDMEWIPPMQESRIDYMEKISEFPNLHRETLKEIFDGGFFSKIEAQWGTVGLKECTKQCGSFDKLGVQFVEN